CAVVVVLWQVSERGNLLEALEDKLDLPANAIAIKYRAFRKMLLGVCGKDDDILGIDERLRLELLPIFAGATPKPTMRLADGLLRLAYYTAAARNGLAAAGRNAHGPTPHIARVLQALQLLHTMEFFARWPGNHHITRIESYRNIS